jgi:hypothetical protein
VATELFPASESDVMIANHFRSKTLSGMQEANLAMPAQ